MKSILENRILRFVVPGILFFALFFFLLRGRIVPFNERIISIKCDRMERVSSLHLTGIITRKFLDYRKSELIQVNNHEFDLFVGEHSNFYDSLKVGDSIHKESGSLKMTVWREGGYFEQDLDYGCED